LLRTGETIIVRMGKKNDTSKPAPAIAEAPASTKTTVSAAAAPAPAAATPPTTNGDGAPGKTAAKTAVRKKPAIAAKKKTPAKKPVTFSTEDIALKAYFIAEDRHRHGLPGDEHSDWIEAERQLRAEARKKAAKKPATAKKR
jgi:hypothetical protein